MFQCRHDGALREGEGGGKRAEQRMRHSHNYSSIAALSTIQEIQLPMPKRWQMAFSRVFSCFFFNILVPALRRQLCVWAQFLNRKKVTNKHLAQESPL